MSAIDGKEAWEEYRIREMREALPLLRELGLELDQAQVHIAGERYLMSGRKLVLTGRRTADNHRVVIKVSSDEAGVREMERERHCRDVLHKLNFAQRTFFTPEELLWTKRDGRAVLVTSYIAQDRTFLTHAVDEQFFLALRAFETQEGVHATTSTHATTIRNVFGLVSSQDYLDAFAGFRAEALAQAPHDTELVSAFEKGWEFLQAHRVTIERYCGFLTHHDFVPHNLRVAGREIYLLDHTSIYFGNKYESWARFLNYMLQYNPPLEQALVSYVRENRGPDEYLSLRLMRVYKIGFLLRFYAQALQRTSGDLHDITRARLAFWTRAMQLIAIDQAVPAEEVRAFIEKQEALRSPEERERQKEILGREKVLME